MAERCLGPGELNAKGEIRKSELRWTAANGWRRRWLDDVVVLAIDGEGLVGCIRTGRYRLGIIGVF
ncbi:MAG: hypothetical protein ACYCSS_14620 [Sulfuriferula sp.]